eukprot:TRINITY_DN19162_c0_g1_i1.p1 TRINITY_DN19162_c0_g1~~TRINITY_DN19162_c0_g1_i1.p1  ORF type:complete len:544 (-),score=98.62 TRINITY_DN19162_c0_g1_i1:57-1688(-)
MLSLLSFVVALHAADAYRKGDDAQVANAASAELFCEMPRAIESASSTLAQCQACAAKKGCKWCALEHRCYAQGIISHHCKREEGTSEYKAKTPEECSARSGWLNIMDEAYGVGWDASARSYVRHIDAVRCIQWQTGAPITKDREMVRQGLPDKDIGTWACFSAMIREGILASMGQKKLPPSYDGESLLQAASAQNVSMRTRWQSETWEPSICRFVQGIKGSSYGCYVRGHVIEKFNRLMSSERDKARGTKEKLIAAALAGPIVQLKPGAGKSGSGFGNLPGEEFKVKLGLKHSAQVDEPDTLMELMTGGPEGMSLVTHFEVHPDSLINKPLGLLKVKLGEERNYAVVLEDAMYHLDAGAQHEAELGRNIHFTRYDLKGASRSQSRMLKTGWTLIDGDFREREQSTVHLSEAQCLKFRQTVVDDTEFLRSHFLIDYSLMLLSVEKDEPGEEGDGSGLSCKPAGGEPFCLVHDRHLYTVSIIDYLNRYSIAKQVESFVRNGKFNRYARKVQTFANKICQTAAERQAGAFQSVTQTDLSSTSDEYE